MAEVKSIQVQDLGRIREIVRVLARHGLGHLFGRLGRDLGVPEGEASASPEPFAIRLRRAMTELGPTFVKLGQVLALRPDILPHDVMVEFQKFHHEVEPMTEADVRHVLGDELSAPFEDVFETFDFAPLGAASIAQVHAATLRTGETVAVKLQRRGIEPVIGSDLHILYTLAQLLEGRVTIPGMYTPAAIIREFDAAIHQELDFHQELAATRRMSSALRDTQVVVPETFPEWSSRRVLMMERIHGAPLSVAMNNMTLEERRAIAHQLMDATYRQVFDHGFFHGDPHPGNLFVTPDGKLAYLDFGVTGLLTASMQDTITATFTAMVFRDPDTLAMAIYRAGATKERIDMRDFRQTLERKMVQYYGASLDDLAQRDTLLEVVEMANRFKIDLPAEFAILARTLTLVEGNIRGLLPEVDIVAEVRPYAERLLRRRFSPERLTQDLGSMLIRLQSQTRELPTQASQALLDLEAGRLTIISKSADLEALQRTVQRAASHLAAAVLAAACIVGGAISFTAPHAELPGRPAPHIFGSMLFMTCGILLLSMIGKIVFGTGGITARARRTLWRIVHFFSTRRET